MTLQTAPELISETSHPVAEGGHERATARPSRLTCRWEQDRIGRLSCVWTLQPEEQ